MSAILFLDTFQEGQVRDLFSAGLPAGYSLTAKAAFRFPLLVGYHHHLSTYSV